MSKKHSDQNNLQNPAQAHAGEYKIIKHDLIKVAVFNFLYLAGILTLYFTNQKARFLETWFNRIWRF